jgi:hypothetical protein
MTMFQKKNLRLAESLLRGKPDTEKENIEESFKASPAFVKALVDRLEFNLDEKVKDSESTKHYLDKDWALYQADSMGYRRALREVLNLFTDRN